MDNRNKSRFGIGLLLGATLGALAGVFLAPKSGKENREDAMKKWQELQDSWQRGEMKAKVQEIFGDVSEESVRLYKLATDELLRRMKELKLSDRQTYDEIVTSVMEWLRTKMAMDQTTEEKAEKLEKKLKDEYDEVEKKTKKIAHAAEPS